MNKKNKYFDTYFNKLNKVIESVDSQALFKAKDMVVSASDCNKKVIILGNGGSAATASHLAIDLTNAAKIRAMSFDSSALITCFGNDFGYENWMSKAIESYANKGDLIIFISSSGESDNIINGLLLAKKNGCAIITLSGFSPTNKLKGLGDVNLWAESNEYNIVEIAHQAWLLAIVDLIKLKTGE